MLPKDKLEKLESEFAILHLVYHRNYNQHRVALWWRHLNIVHRGVRKVLRGIYEAESAKKIKRREELQKQVVLTANYLVLRVMKRAYYHFNSVIALGQFVNLGFVLVASLSALRLLLMEIEGVGGRNVIKEEIGIQDDVGEEVAYDQVLKAPEPVANINFLDEAREIKPKKAKSEKSDKKQKKKKKRSAIDDIFG